MKKFTFHILGLCHLPANEKFNSCAFTGKIIRLCSMLKSLGHTVYFYGSEGSDVECDEFIQTHSLSDIRKEWGEGWNLEKDLNIGYDWHKNDFKHDFNTERTETTKKYYRKAIDEILQRKKDDDFLLITQGQYQKPIGDAVGFYLTCEPGVGYRGVYTKFKAFESAYLQNFIYGSQHPFESINGNFYDRVIPNYFDMKDFKFSAEKDNYFLYIGRLIQRKGVEIAVMVSDHLKVPLKIAGQGVKSWDPEKKILKTQYGLTLQGKYIDYVGFADAEKRSELMSRARAVFVPTLYLEAFGGVNVEAQLCGTPVITTNFSCFDKSVIHGITGYRCDTLDDFVRAGRNVDKLDYKKIREIAINRYSMDSVKWQYQKWFEDLYFLYQSFRDNKLNGWHRIREDEPDWVKYVDKPDFMVYTGINEKK